VKEGRGTAGFAENSLLLLVSQRTSAGRGFGNVSYTYTVCKHSYNTKLAG